MHGMNLKIYEKKSKKNSSDNSIEIKRRRKSSCDANKTAAIYSDKFM